MIAAFAGPGTSVCLKYQRVKIGLEGLFGPLLACTDHCPKDGVVGRRGCAPIGHSDCHQFMPRVHGPLGETGHSLGAEKVANCGWRLTSHRFAQTKDGGTRG
jgi:hypothetical protein